MQRFQDGENKYIEIPFKERVYQSRAFTKMESSERPTYTLSHPPDTQQARNQSVVKLKSKKNIKIMKSPADGRLESTLMRGIDRREMIEDRARLIKHPCSSILRFEIYFGENIYAGTGVLVGPSHALTCAHNLFRQEDKKWARKIEVFAGAHKNTAYFGTTFACFGYSFEECDLALLVLDRPLGQYAGWLPMATYTATNFFQERTFQILGYPNENGNNEVMYGHHGEIRKRQKNKLFYDIDTNPGQSGSPILEYKGSQLFVIGIHTQGCDETETDTESGDESEKLNKGEYLSSSRLSTIIKWIEERFISEIRRETKEEILSPSRFSNLTKWIKNKISAIEVSFIKLDRSVSNSQSINKALASLSHESKLGGKSITRVPHNDNPIHIQGAQIIERITESIHKNFMFIQNDANLVIEVAEGKHQQLGDVQFANMLRAFGKRSGNFKWKELKLSIWSDKMTDKFLPNFRNIISSECFRGLESLTVGFFMCPEITIKGIEKFVREIIECLKSHPKKFARLTIFEIKLAGCEKIQRHTFEKLNEELDSVSQLQTKAVVNSAEIASLSEMEDEENSNDGD